MLSPELMEDAEISRASHDATDDILAAVVTPGLYRKNPFRLTGAGVLAGMREINRRIDQLKMAAELALPVTGWAFAPDWALTLDALRAVTQMVKDPKARLLQEFFWFWPDNYPEDGPTPVLDMLAQGDTEMALSIWGTAATEGSITAWHNLAVYHHLLALDWEKNDKADGEPPRELWNHAAQYWQSTLDDDTLWERLQQRVALVGDAQLPPEFVGRLRALLPDMLAGINATLAFQHAERGGMDRARFHVSLVAGFHRQAPQHSVRLLEAAVRPAVRRVEICLAEARASVARDASSALAEAEALVKNSDADLRLISELCGSGSDCHRELSHQVADTALDAIGHYQRVTADNRHCLPLLIVLLNMETSPELARRLAATFQVVFDYAAADEPQEDFSTQSPFTASPMGTTSARRLEVITAEIIPGPARLGLEGASAANYASRVAAVLRSIGYAASRQHDDIELAMRAFGAALELPCSDELRNQLENQRYYLYQEHQAKKDRELVLEVGETSLIIDARGIGWNGQWTSPSEITGLRHGLTTEEPMEGGLSSHYLVAWSSPGGGEFLLDPAYFSPEGAGGSEEYQKIVDALDFFLAPALAERLVDMIRRGDTVMLGDSLMSPEGMLLDASRLFWKRAQLVPYQQLKYEFEGGILILSSLEDPKLSQSYDIARTWNAAIIGRIIDNLAGRQTT